MTSLERFPISSTSADGAMLRSPKSGAVLIIGGLLATPEYSTASSLSAESISRSTKPLEQTTAGASLAAKPLGGAIAELRRLGGFTWEQIARLFQVSRRSIHFWASGKMMSPRHEEHLHRVLSVMRRIDRGSASANRAALFTEGVDNIAPFNSLAEAQYDLVISLLGHNQTHRRIQAPEISADAMSARAPRPPEELVEALHDRVHPTSGRLLSSKPVRAPRGK